MVKLIGKDDPQNRHIIPLIDARSYNDYQKSELFRIVDQYCNHYWKDLPRCTTHSILSNEDYDNYGPKAEISDCAAAPLKDFDTVIVLKNGKAFRARFCESKSSRPEARLVCGLIRPSYWFDCYLYERKNSRPFSAIFFNVIDGELYANHIYYLSSEIFNDHAAKKSETTTIVAAPENNALAIEILQACYNAWVLTQWLRIERPTIEKPRKPKKPNEQKKPRKPSAGREQTKRAKVEYNDRFVPTEPEKPAPAERIAIIDGKLVRNYTRKTDTWIRRAHVRKLRDGSTTAVKAALCGKKTPEAQAIFEEYLKDPQAIEERIAASTDVFYRCHHRPKKSKT